MSNEFDSKANPKDSYSAMLVNNIGRKVRGSFYQKCCLCRLLYEKKCDLKKRFLKENTLLTNNIIYIVFIQKDLKES